MNTSVEQALSKIRLIPDYPIPGVLFRDITPMIADPESFSAVVNALGQSDFEFDVVAGIEARGFILGAAISQKFSRGFIPLRKKGKLPFTTIGKSYGLEYGADIIEAHIDAAKPGDKIILVDDVLATGGTILAGLELLTELGATVTEVVILLEIEELEGRSKIQSKFPEIKLRSLLKV